MLTSGDIEAVLALFGFADQGAVQVDVDCRDSSGTESPTGHPEIAIGRQRDGIAVQMNLMVFRLQNRWRGRRRRRDGRIRDGQTW